MTTVSIEEVDESWALKLLNECEIEDEPITIKTGEFRKKINKCHDYRESVSNYLEPIHEYLETPECKYDDLNKYDDLKESGASLLSLSAIEYQTLELAEQKKIQKLAEQTGKRKSYFNFARFKALFRSKDLI